MAGRQTFWTVVARAEIERRAERAQYAVALPCTVRDPREKDVVYRERTDQEEQGAAVRTLLPMRAGSGDDHEGKGARAKILSRPVARWFGEAISHEPQ